MSRPIAPPATSATARRAAASRVAKRICMKVGPGGTRSTPGGLGGRICGSKREPDVSDHAHPAPPVRIVAVQALGANRAREVLPELKIMVLGDENVAVREAARKAINMIEQSR
jgi:hypothetical protein